MSIGARLPALDGMRAIAIIMVVAVHTHDMFQPAISVPAHKIAAACVNGVQLFFVVSAFTLGSQFLGEFPPRLREFWFRRIARVGPAYWLAGLI